jgi:protein-S-isoprenylcysteine O-methyltransferase Ste14
MGISWRKENIPLPEAHLIGLGLSNLLHRARPISIRRSRTTLAVGAVLLLSGIGAAMWATRIAATTHMANPDRLITNGPYDMSRNPMYVGWTMGYLGSAFLSGSGWPLVLLPGVAIAIHKTVLGEEIRLKHQFGDDFRAYASRVPRYIRISRTPEPGRDPSRTLLSLLEDGVSEHQRGKVGRFPRTHRGGVTVHPRPFLP